MSITQQNPATVREFTAEARMMSQDASFVCRVTPGMIPRETESITLTSGALFTGEALGIQYEYNCDILVVNGLIAVQFQFGLSPEHPELKYTKAHVKCVLTDALGRSIGVYDPIQAIRVEPNAQTTWNTQIPLNNFYGVLEQQGDSAANNNDNEDTLLFRLDAIIRTDTLTTTGKGVVVHPGQQLSRANVVKLNTNTPGILAPPAMTWSDRLNLFHEQISNNASGNGNQANLMTTLEHVGRRSLAGPNDVPVVSDVWVKIDQD